MKRAMHLFSIRRALTAGAILSFLLLTAPQPAHAQFAVIDPTNLVQNTINALNSAAEYTMEYALDGLAWQAANLAIESITKSTVNWINSGFDGSPAFVTDLNQNLRGVGDAVAARFFDELAMQDIATTPFQDQVLDSVRLGYYLSTSPESFYTRYPYTLNQVSANDRAFLAGDFSQGGWNAWFATVMNPQNNPYGAQMLANEALENAVAGATGNRLEELSWNRGFLSWRGECTAQRDVNDPVLLGGVDACASYEIETPGSVIMEQLNQQLGSGVNRLVSADEFNEVIGALLNQLASQVLGGGSGGLRGVSRPASGGGGSFVDQATGPSQGGNSANISRNFSATLTSQRQRLESFRTSWQRIQTAAQAAEQRCGANGQPNPQTVLNRAAAALVKAANAIAAIDAIQAKVTAANSTGGNQTLALLEISEEYNALSVSGTLPTVEEIAEAQSGSQDTGDSDPGSLYSQMTRLANSSCRISGE